MERLTYKESMKDLEKGIFYYINSISPFEWSSVVTPDNLDNAFLRLNGNYLISDCINDSMVNNAPDLQMLAQIIKDLYFFKWNKIYDILIQEVPLLQSYIEEISEETTGETTNTNNSAIGSTIGTVNKVSAYNESDFVNKDNEEQTENRTDNTTNNGTNNGTRTVTKKGFNGSYSKDLNEQIIYLKNNLIYDIIFNDVKSILMLSIFKGC